MSKVKVGVLGATGSVGQRFIQLLENHEYFEVVALGASDKSAGNTYKEVMKSRWKVSSKIPDYVSNMKISRCVPKETPNVDLVFSGLDSDVAGEVETEYAKAGVMVISNSKNHRYDKDVPILSAEVNAEQLKVLDAQKTPGKIITNSNCTIMGVTITLKPLMDAYGIDSVFLVSMQAVSGAGYPGVPSLDILGNVVPHIGGEEEKVEMEPQKCLGKVSGGKIVPANFKITAHCNRVPVVDGHTVCISVKLKKKTTAEKIKKLWADFSGEPQKLKLPSAPKQVIDYREEIDRPQPRLDLMSGNGMTTTVGRLRPDPIFDFKYVVLSHNTIRGAAGAAILNAELIYKKGYLRVK
ncbi:MAG TPA: aspartate-semialdehyde dehydrogenase [Leptospiraceae bacterium]|nr:aspartate-semialdehyde dehydrogenase [Leptospiraceae bacterium]HMW03812.1 aspartate-semialdehyde dehydrogenase [Leptospiraceae bacterium]HMX33052.1 aspartate-semialdehyde dehydrogenase [Leptospiraceae bacterium]HMY29792.1 aspartate-semialdehyde dehydrogenase [Leptospiraceae bacterium]HMZ62809.1 aspartate-semialdehyde dehydrogenase [Leptospiraceae bacterium]